MDIKHSKVTFRRAIDWIPFFGSQWKMFWGALTPWQKLWPISFVGLYWGTLWSLSGLRSDHFALGAVLLVLNYLGPEARRFLSVFWPVLATAIIYDSQRFYSDYIRGPIHVSEPYDFDKRFFGIKTDHGVLTPNEYFAIHTNWFVDLITGFAYLVFVGEYFLFGLFSYFVSRKSRFAYRVALAFLIVNLIGYSTYYWYAAAPPWYVSLYGFGPARMDVGPNPAACIRFDELLGTHFFTGMYGRSADVFGAIPSLHVAYPLLAVLFSFRMTGVGSRFWQVFSIGFWLLMVFSAVYLQHHYILDILWGSAYAVIVYLWQSSYLKREASI